MFLLTSAAGVLWKLLDIPRLVEKIMWISKFWQDRNVSQYVKKTSEPVGDRLKHISRNQMSVL